ncbi:hypothetical protein CASFOL_006211 [Castilleja foliolosa]|uniref:Uncharacterized protein n=1 Tax=Castilleja foliolosa TaxID=1961234 RepID=A0ABD3E5N3_9LAMI
MFNSQFFWCFKILTTLFLLADHYCLCISHQSNNGSIDNGFSQAIATWYGGAYGPGSTGGACGYGEDVSNPPYNGIISAGNPFLYKAGKGCGNCYEVKCTEHPACSGYPVHVTITDECPGCDGSVHFDLSGKAFNALAKPGQDGTLRGVGKINIQYQSVQCYYSVGITFKIDPGSNPNYIAFAIEYVGGDGDIGYVELSSPNSKGWLGMQQSWGATWKTQLNGISGPYSVKVTTIESKKAIYATNVIPANWVPGAKYHG